MGHTTFERTRDAGLERLCVECRDWWPIELFSKSKKCFRGRTRECRACRAARRKRNGEFSKRKRWTVDGKPYAHQVPVT